MKNTTKGALAAGAAVVLLLGGAGTLAFWTAEDTADGGDINSGVLTLTGGDCDADWVYAAGAAGAGGVVDLFVPGDEVTKQCTFTIGATGDNLTATVGAPASVEYDYSAGATSADINTSATYALGAPNPRAVVDGGTITDADNGKTLTVTFLAEIPYGSDETGTPVVNGNDTQGIVAALDTLTVTLTQVDPNP